MSRLLGMECGTVSSDMYIYVCICMYIYGLGVSKNTMARMWNRLFSLSLIVGIIFYCNEIEAESPSPIKVPLVYQSHRIFCFIFRVQFECHLLKCPIPSSEIQIHKTHMYPTRFDFDFKYAVDVVVSIAVDNGPLHHFSLFRNYCKLCILSISRFYLSWSWPSRRHSIYYFFSSFGLSTLRPSNLFEAFSFSFAKNRG